MKDLESIDKYLVSEIDGLESTPSDHVWNSIDSKLQANKAARNSRGKKIKMISAATVVTVATTLVLTYNNFTKEKDSTPVVTEQKIQVPAEKNNIITNEGRSVSKPAQSENNTVASKGSASLPKVTSNELVTTTIDAVNDVQNATVSNKKDETPVKTEPIAAAVNDSKKAVSESKKDNSDKNIIMLPYFAPGYTGSSTTQTNKASAPGPSVNTIKNDQPETPKTDPKENTVYMPNAFTPNGDGLNDVFLPQTAETPSEYKLSVFDRAGNLVFYSEDIQRGWDGRTTHNGLEEVKEDVYIWRIEIKTSKGEKRHLMGSVTLLK